MKNTKLLRTTLISSIALALTACGGAPIAIPAPRDTTRSLSSMSVVNDGFKPLSLALTI